MNNEDIRVLEELQKVFVELRKDDEEGHGSAYELQWEDIQAIENLIKGYKELEEENESLVKQYEYQGALMTNEYLSKEEVEEWFIPKSKVREKIEELENVKAELDIDKVEDDFLSLEDYFAKKNRLIGEIYILQELLQEGDTNETKM